MPVKRLVCIIGFIFILNNITAETNPLAYLNRILNYNEADLDKSYKRLSEGTYLLPDNPANRAIYEKLEAHIRGLGGLIRNNGDLISYYQTADGYLSVIPDLLQNIRELLIKRSNAIYSPEDREYIDLEIDQYYDHIFFTLEHAEFNKKQIFKELLMDESIKERLRGADYHQLGNVNDLFNFFLSQRASYGAVMKTLELRNQGMAVSTENMNEFQSSLWDIDMATDVSRLKKYHLLLLVNLLLFK